MSERDPRHDLEQAWAETAAALPACPTAEEISAFRENRLGEERAFQVEFHLHDCAECIELMERLDAPADEPGFTPEEEARLELEIAGRLGLDRPPRRSPLAGVLSRLWNIRTPLYVPAAAVVLLLAVVWYAAPPHPTEPATASVTRTVTTITIDQAALRSGKPAAGRHAVSAGDVVLVEIYLDGLAHAPGDPVTWTAIDGDGRERFSGETQVLEEYSLRLAIAIPEPGSWTLRFTAAGGGEVIESVALDIRSVNGR